jgi:uncharacterized protein (DUF427 family)
MKIPDTSHPITIEPAAEHVVVRAGGRVVADTTSALRLQEAAYPAVYYLPLADVDETLVTRTDTSTHCPYKGDAAYYSIITPEGEIADAIWTYEEPYPAVEPIRSHVAFYAHRVEIDATPA